MLATMAGPSRWELCLTTTASVVYALCAIREVGRYAHDDDDADDSFCVRGPHMCAVCLIVII